MIRVSLISLDKYKRGRFEHEISKVSPTSFFPLLSHVLRIPPSIKLGFIVEFEKRNRIKDPSSSSSRLGERAVVEPLVDKGGAQPDNREEHLLMLQRYNP